MTRLAIGQCASLACLLEAATPKPGNVHRGADFDDLHFNDFLVSAVIVGREMERACASGVGATVVEAIRGTRQLVSTNTNLGTVLLLAPLAAVPRSQSLAEGLPQVLQSLTAQDAQLVYEAIRLAQPGGLGQVSEMDVHAVPPNDLRQAMAHAAERDLVARQYTNGYAEVLGRVLPWILGGRARGWTLTMSIIHAFVQLLAEFPDSLISRKCGPEVAQRAADFARQILASGSPEEVGYLEGLADLDFWLRSDEHRRNPGTSADLIAAALFAGLRDGLIEPPFR